MQKGNGSSAKGETVSVGLSNGNRAAGVVADFIGSSILKISVQGKEVVGYVNEVWERSPVNAVKADIPPAVPNRKQPPRSCKRKVNYKTLTR